LLDSAMLPAVVRTDGSFGAASSSTGARIGVRSRTASASRGGVVVARRRRRVRHGSRTPFHGLTAARGRPPASGDRPAEGVRVASCRAEQQSMDRGQVGRGQVRRGQAAAITSRREK
jgi:hypothetical protein